jgi:pyruvate,water dikinase
MVDKFVKGPSPFDQPQMGIDFVPSYLRFRPGDEVKFWMRDAVHTPEPLYPLEYETTFCALSWYAVSYGTEVNKVPTSHGVAARILNGWCYLNPIDIADPVEIEKRAPMAEEICAKVYAGWEQWVAETDAPHRKAADWLASFDFEREPDLNDTRQLYSLIERFDAVIAALYASAGTHLENLVLLFGQKLSFGALCTELVPGTPDEDISKMLQGFGNNLMETDRAFWKLGELARDLDIAHVVRGPLGDVVPDLSKTSNGRKWLEELNKTVKEYGMRHVGGCYNLMPVSWLEDLNFPISFIRGFMEKMEKEEVLVPEDALVAEREQVVSEFRAKIEKQEDKKKFDENLNLLQRMYPWYEDHNFLYEGRVGTGVHLNMIALGRRLVNEGYLDDPYDIGYLLLHELRQLLFELMNKHMEFRIENLMDVRPMIEERKKIREEQLKWKPPVVLGLKPVVPPENPVAIFVHGALPEIIDRAFAEIEKPEDILEIAGLSAAPGVAEGVARVIFDVNQLKEVLPGEILVCGSTNPMWNAVFGKVKGVVTDTGGLLAHAGVICREYGLPAVVGSAIATRVIKTGDRLRVDGTQGIVTKITCRKESSDLKNGDHHK